MSGIQRELHSATAAAAQEHANVDMIQEALHVAEAAVARLKAELETTKKREGASQVCVTALDHRANTAWPLDLICLQTANLWRRKTWEHLFF